MHSPIFIVGTPRSGTTLLTNILDRHPGISIYYESKFFKTLDILKIRNPLDKIEDIDFIISQIKNLDLAGLAATEIKSRFLNTNHTYKSLLDTTLKLRMEKNGKTRFGEKNTDSFPIFRFIVSILS